MNWVTAFNLGCMTLVIHLLVIIVYVFSVVKGSKWSQYISYAVFINIVFLIVLFGLAILFKPPMG